MMNIGNKLTGNKNLITNSKSWTYFVLHFWTFFGKL